MRCVIILSVLLYSAITVDAQSSKSDSLFVIGVNLYHAGEYKKAIPVFLECDRLDKAELDSISNRRIYSAMWLASCYYNIGEEHTAKKYYEHYKERPVDRRLTIMSDSLSLLGLKYREEKNYNEALECFLKCLEIEKEVVGEYSLFLANTLYSISQLYSYIKQYDNAVNYTEKVVNIYQRLGHEKTMAYIILLNKLAIDYCAVGANEKAINIMQRAKKEAERICGERDDNIIAILANLGYCYKCAKQYEQAAEYYRQAVNLQKDLVGENDFYAVLLNNEAQCYALSYNFDKASVAYEATLSAYRSIFEGRTDKYLNILEQYYGVCGKAKLYERAVELGGEIIAIRKKLIGEEGLRLAVIYRYQAENLVAIERFQEALSFANKSQQIYRKHKGIESEEYATSLAYTGYCYSYVGDYKNAIDSVKKAIEIRRNTIGENAPNFLTAVLNLGTYYKEIYQYEKAIACAQFVVGKRKEILGENHVEYASSLFWLADFYNGQGLYSDAIRLEEQVCKILNSKDNEAYLMALGSLASYYSNSGNHLKAIELGKQSLQICKEILSDSCSSYVMILENLGAFYSNYGNNKEAIRLSESALVKSIKLYGQNHLRNASILNRMSDYHQQLGNYETALSLARKALEIREQYKDSHPIEYANSLGTLSVVYTQLGSDKKAKEYALSQQQILRDVLGKKHPKYMQCLANYGQILLNIGDFQQAMAIEDEALNICRDVFGEDNIAYFEILEKKANVYSSVNNINDEIALYKRISDFSKNHLPPAHPFYIRNQRNMAQALLDQGHFIEARNVLMEIEPLIAGTFGKQHPTYSRYLNSLSEFYKEIGALNYAITLLQEELMIEKKLYGENHHIYANCLNELALCYWGLRDFGSAIECSEKATRIIENLYGNDDYRYAISLGNLCVCYSTSKIEDLRRSVRYGESALDLIEKNKRKESSYYATILENLSSSYAKIGNIEKAIEMTKRAMSLRRKMLGETNHNYIFLYQTLSAYYASINDTLNVSKCEKEFIDKISKYILKFFTSLTSKERESFWNQYLPYFNLACMASYKIPEGELRKIAYNSILFSKGLLLNADIEMEKMVMESNDSSVLELYRQMRKNQKLLDRQYQIPISSRYLNVDSLENVISNQDIELVNKSKAFGDFTKKIQVKWEDVRNALSPMEVAIEFERFSTKSGIIYVAYLIKHDCESPIMIPLCEEKQIQNSLNQRKLLCKLIWEPMKNEVGDVKSVFFAPSGELYNIPIESLPYWGEDCLMADKWNMYRLSSTRQLAITKNKENIKDASVFGGIKYDMDTNLLATDGQGYQIQNRSMSISGVSIADSLNLRNGVAYLPATKMEAEDIDKTLEQKRINTILKIDTLATEGAFKDLSGKKTNLLHIATHGFYWTEREAEKMNNLQFLMLAGGKQQPKFVEDKALTRSGLLFAGANNALMGKKLPEGVDDGILTAKEISQLDLRGLDLVVLSACQTGLGEIKGDGVFGLQRGFKKAGANSIMMSLWKVDDEATRLLMTQFYKNLTSGKSKNESLCEAQRYVREYEKEIEVKSDSRPVVSVHAKTQVQRDVKEKQYKKVRPYHDPKYWAAFILLDAID